MWRYCAGTAPYEIRSSGLGFGWISRTINSTTQNPISTHCWGRGDIAENCFQFTLPYTTVPLHANMGHGDWSKPRVCRICINPPAHLPNSSPLAKRLMMRAAMKDTLKHPKASLCCDMAWINLAVKQFRQANERMCSILVTCRMPSALSHVLYTTQGETCPRALVGHLSDEEMVPGRVSSTLPVGSSTLGIWCGAHRAATKMHCPFSSQTWVYHQCSSSILPGHRYASSCAGLRFMGIKAQRPHGLPSFSAAWE